ncbi:hypothetical protein H0H87_001617, partial [Tephrocybe sp. NHM501043]
MAGIDWVLTDSQNSGRPAVAQISLGGAASDVVDKSVLSLTNAGIHTVVSAGNKNTHAGNQSPARAPTAITVGATTIADERWPNSNYGKVVDIFAPGGNIVSLGINSNTV